MKTFPFFLILSLFFAISCGGENSDSDPSPIQPEDFPTELEVLMEGRDVVWGFDFLPDKRIIFTERSGDISILDPASGVVAAVSGEPQVADRGEGGLLDIRLDPDFQQNGLVYFCFSEPSGTNNSSLTLSRAQLQAQALINLENIFISNEPKSSNLHFGCRIEFDNQNGLFLSLGERGDRVKSQDISSYLGKILRMNRDGTGLVIFSSGHRNVQGLAVNPSTGELWASELGPTGGDELNIIRQDGNYGWPFISQGEDSNGLIEATTRAGFVDPVTFWTPSISPSAMTFFQGNIYLATLSGQHLRRLVMSGEAIISEEELFADRGWRFRNVRPGPDGFLYFSTDEGRLGMIKNL